MKDKKIVRVINYRNGHLIALIEANRLAFYCWKKRLQLHKREGNVWYVLAF